MALFNGNIIGAPLKEIIPYPVSFDWYSVSQSAASGGFTCDVCEVVVYALQELLQTDAAEDDIINVAINICIDLQIEDKNVCESIVPLYKVSRYKLVRCYYYCCCCCCLFLQTEVLTVVDKVALKPSEACGILLGDGCGTPYDPYNQNWTVPLPIIPKPPINPIPAPAVCFLID